MIKIGGIRRGYPLIPAPKKLKAIIALIRPLTLIGAFIAGFFLVLFASKIHNIEFDIFFAIRIGFILGILQAGSQAMNQSIYEEILIDKLNGKDYRPVFSNTISLKEGRTISLLLLAAGILLSFLVCFSLGLFALAIVFFGLFYSLPPLRLKKRFIINLVSVAFSRFGLPVFAVFAIFGNPFTPITVSLCIFGLFLGMGIQSSKDFGTSGQEITGDKRFNIKTLFVCFGFEKAVQIMYLFITIAFLSLLLFIYLQFIPLHFLALLLLAIPSFFVCHSIKKGWILELTENSVSWLCFYITLGFYYILPPLLI